MAMLSLQRNSKSPKPVTKKKVIKNYNIDRKYNIVNDKNKVRVNLIKHEGVSFSPEYFSYLNDNNEEVKFSGIVIKDIDDSYIGKQMISNKVILEYHPNVESVSHSTEHFTYINENGKEKVFIGEPEYDLENNTYIGIVKENVLHDEIVEIFEEK